MKTRLIKFARLLCLLSLFAITRPLANAQSIVNAEPRFDIDIENGRLSLEPLKSHPNINVKEIWGQGDIHNVPATIVNLTKYVRAVAPVLNIVVAPQAAEVQIQELKLRGADMAEVAEAAEIASDESVHGGPSPGINNWHFGALAHYADRKVEVFNISGFIQSLGKPSNDEVQKKLEDIEQLIYVTLKQLHQNDPKHVPSPEIRYHAGTSLLIVVGSQESIEVTRKFINALPGQSPGKRQDLLDIPPAAQQK